PLVLRRAPAESEELGDGSLRVTSWYALREPVRLEAPIVSGLDRFDGRTTPEIVDELKASAGGTLDVGVLRLLVDPGLLVCGDDDEARAIEAHRPVEAEDRLSTFRWFRFPEISGGLEPGPSGASVFVLRVGPKQITFSDPEMHAFAQMLVGRHNGFIAR